MKSIPPKKEQSEASILPGWLRRRYAHDLDAEGARLDEEAEADGIPVGVLADRRIKAVLAQAGERSASAATVAAYRRDYALMLEERTTPAEKATTFQHYNRLRSAWRFCEAEAIRAIRLTAERCRKEGDRERMMKATRQAVGRAIIYERMFLDDDRPTWGEKAKAIRAKGEVIKSKSKRAAGRSAPTPDELLVALGKQRRRAGRVDVLAAVISVFGCRPAELKNGVLLAVDGDGVSATIRGAKVDAMRGQPSRLLVVDRSRRGNSGVAVDVLRDEVRAGRCLVSASDNDLRALRRSLSAIQPGLSPYAYRHARASDAKSSGDTASVAAWLGHRSDKTQKHYGHRQSSRGVVRIKAARAARPVRAVKQLPALRRHAGSMSAAVAALDMVPSTVRVRRPRLRR